MATPITPDEIAEGLAVLRWSTSALAAAVEVDESTARRWLRGVATMPDPLARWFRKLVAAHRAIRPPTAPKRAGPGRPAGGHLFGVKAEG